MTKFIDPTGSMTNMGASALQAAKRALADSVAKLLKTSPFCSRVAVADSVENHLEESLLWSKVAHAHAVGGRISE